MKALVSRADRRFNIIVNTLMVALLCVTLYPLYFVVIASFSNPDLTYAGKVVFLPKGITFAGYQTILGNSRLWLSYRNTLVYTSLGTTVNLALTLPAAYALSRKRFKARVILNLVMLFTMFFSGGLIPTYLLVRDLGLIDSLWAVILVSGVSVWNLIIARTYFSGNIAEELEESAFLDGCSHIRFFLAIALPLSKVIIVVLGLFYGISHWNGYFNALIYLNSTSKYPLQLFLREVLVQQQTLSMEPGMAAGMRHTATLVKYAMIVIASGPMLLMYPFLQKYFVKGVMIGSIKG